MTEQAQYATTEELISHMRFGRMMLLLIDNSEGDATGVVTLAAELCEPHHITFMARQARGLVCLGLTRARCEHLNLPLMVEGEVEAEPFTLSIEASEGIDTGISAVDRARTVRVAVASDSKATDLVQPGHIFPIAAADGGVLTRADKSEATTDLAAIAGMLPAAVFTEVLDKQGNVARGESLWEFARSHDLPVGRVSDLVTYRLANERTIECIRKGTVETTYGPLEINVYRETSKATLHIALVKGELNSELPTLVRVHVTSVLRDLVGTTLNNQVSWRFDNSLKSVSEAERAVLVLITRPETADVLLAGVDRLLGRDPQESVATTDSYASIGLGAQILNDLGVGKIDLMGAPLKYNALAGFGLEVCDFVAPTH